MKLFGNDWDDMLSDELSLPYLDKLWAFLHEEYATKQIFPKKSHVFNALKYTSFSDTRVVIIGQDPYHGAGQANGLCFSVNDGVRVPPSLGNIYKEISDEYGTPIPKSGNLSAWAHDGVLLLNTCLTVRSGEPKSHSHMGWERFTDKIIDLLSHKSSPLVFLLWGADAAKKAAFVSSDTHLTLTSSHPSPLSVYRGFSGSGHFKKCNDFLIAHNARPVNWTSIV